MRIVLVLVEFLVEPVFHHNSAEAKQRRDAGDATNT